MKLLDGIKKALFGPSVWSMDKDYKVNWQTEYSNDYTKSLEKQLNIFNHKISIFTLTGNIEIRKFLKKKFKITSDNAYMKKLEELLNNEIESYLLNQPRNVELIEQIKNIEFLGSNYDSEYDHKAYIKASKQRQGK